MSGPAQTAAAPAAAANPAAPARPRRRLAEVVERLRLDIATGVHAIGSRLPTEEQLCARFAIGRHTAREAVRSLREQGLVASQQGAGSTVIARRITEPFELEAQSIDDLVAYAVDLYTDVVSVTVAAVDRACAARMGVAAGEEWLMMRGIARTRDDDRAVCTSEVLIHRDFAAVGRLIPRQSGPTFLLLEDLFAIRVGELDQTIAGATLVAPLAGALDCAEGTPALAVRRTFRLDDGKIAQISLHTHPLAGFHQSQRLYRTRR